MVQLFFYIHNMQKFGICLLSQIPIRQSINHSSEMVSELLFGDSFCIEDSYQHWLKIRTTEDKYEGWVDIKQICFIDNDTCNTIKDEVNKTYVGEHGAKVQNSQGEIFRIGFGSRLPLFNENEFSIGANSFIYTQEIIQIATRQTENLQTIAMSFLHTPYLWGGRSSSGIDCSGFVQMVYKLCGISLPRDAKDQAKEGSLITFFEEALPNDLIFFDNRDEQIVHVGIYMGKNKIIHASGQVRIDAIDHQGILASDGSGYTHNLRLINRI